MEYISVKILALDGYENNATYICKSKYNGKFVLVDYKGTIRVGLAQGVVSKPNFDCKKVIKVIDEETISLVSP